MRKQINEILGREVTDAEFQGIDFSGVIEDLEPNYDDFSSSIIGPMSIIAAGMACILMGISIHDRFAFLGVAYSVGTWKQTMEQAGYPLEKEACSGEDENYGGD